MQRSPGSVGVTPFPPTVSGQMLAMCLPPTKHHGAGGRGAAGRQSLPRGPHSLVMETGAVCVVISAMTGDARGAGLRFGRASWKKRPLC